MQKRTGYNDSPVGLIVVLSAPSGAGKTSILNKILKLHPEISFSVSVTTRQPRDNERDGVDYHFISDKQFDTYLRDDYFVEWAEVHGNRYGTLKTEISHIVETGGTIILDTDTVGAFNIKNLYSDAVLIFIAPPSPDVLADRLKKRNTETEQRLQQRLAAVPVELSRMNRYDYIVINDDLDTAVTQVETIIEAENLKSLRVIPLLSKWRDYFDRK